MTLWVGDKNNDIIIARCGQVPWRINISPEIPDTSEPPHGSAEETVLSASLSMGKDSPLQRSSTNWWPVVVHVILFHYMSLPLGLGPWQSFWVWPSQRVCLSHTSIQESLLRPQWYSVPFSFVCPILFHPALWLPHPVPRFSPFLLLPYFPVEPHLGFQTEALAQWFPSFAPTTHRGTWPLPDSAHAAYSLALVPHLSVRGTSPGITTQLGAL